MPKNSPKRWVLYAHGVGNQCPAHVLSMPSTWSLSAHVTGIKRPCTGRNSSSFLALCESASLDECLLQLATTSHHSFILLQRAARPAILEAGHTEILRGLDILVNCLVYLLLKLVVQVLEGLA